MLEFLKSKYSRQTASSVLKSWASEANQLKRNYSFDSFKVALGFQGVISDLLTNTTINFSINNVYNQVTIEVDNELTTRDLAVLENIERLYQRHLHICKDSLARAENYTNPERLQLRNNIQTITSSYKHEIVDFYEDVKLLH